MYDHLSPINIFTVYTMYMHTNILGEWRESSTDDVYTQHTYFIQQFRQGI